MIVRGENIYALCVCSWTLLREATHKGQIEIVKILLENHANINDSTSTGRTPLHLACQEGHIEVVKTFLENGADLHLLTNEKAGLDKNKTPLMIAKERNDHQIVSLIEEFERNRIGIKKRKRGVNDRYE